VEKLKIDGLINVANQVLRYESEVFPFMADILVSIAADVRTAPEMITN